MATTKATAKSAAKKENGPTAITKPKAKQNVTTKKASNTKKTSTATKTQASKGNSAPKKTTAAPRNPPNIGRPRKRKSEDEESEVNVRTKARKVNRPAKATPKPPGRRTKASGLPATETPSAALNARPSLPMKIFVFGSNQQGELGLGEASSPADVKRPRLNPNLDPATVGVVQISAGGMHTAALTKDNKILTWGVNDLGALGRDTEWTGGLKDVDAEDSDEDEGALNPKEATPMPVDMSALDSVPVFVQVAAGDNFTIALTEVGDIYGWGTFKASDGATGFSPGISKALQPTPIPMPAPIKKIVAGSNHAIALTMTGTVLAWGNGEDYQLGRHINERTRLSPLEPHSFGLIDNFVDIGTGSNHSFAIHKSGSVYAWGKNNFCQTGIDKTKDKFFENIIRPTALRLGRDIGKVTNIAGGKEHSILCTDSGACLSWGRLDTYALGVDFTTLPGGNMVLTNERGQPVILKTPDRVSNLVIGVDVASVAASSDHSIITTKEGKAMSSGFSGNHQTGQGTDDDIEYFMQIDNTAVREQRLVWAGCGGQYSILAAFAEDKEPGGA